MFLLIELDACKLECPANLSIARIGYLLEIGQCPDITSNSAK